MENKKFYAIMGGIGIVVLACIIYLVVVFTSGKSKTKKVDSFKSFSNEKQIYDNKKKAYDDLTKDSVNIVHENNVRVDPAAIFGNKEPDKPTTTELIPEESTGNKVKDDKRPETRTRPKNINYSASVHVPKTVTVENKTPQQPVQQQTPPKKRDAFFSSFADDNKKTTIENTKIIRAVVHSQQTVYTGATVKLRLTSDCNIGGNKVPANTYVYGRATIVDERVTISITSIDLSDNIIPITLSVYDKDGIQGIYIPGLAVHEATKQGVDQAASEAARLNVPYVGSVPVNVARKRNNMVTATLIDNYNITLK